MARSVPSSAFDPGSGICEPGGDWLGHNSATRSAQGMPSADDRDRSRARCIPLESEEKCLPGVPLLEGLAQALHCGIRHTAYGIRYTSCTSFSCQVPDMLSEKGLA